MAGFRGLGTPVLEGVALAGLARCDEADGDLAHAMERYEQALAVARRIGEPAVTATALEGMGRLAFGRGERDAADALFREAADVRARSGRPAPPHERRDLEALLATRA